MFELSPEAKRKAEKWHVLYVFMGKLIYRKEILLNKNLTIEANECQEIIQMVENEMGIVSERW